MKYTTAGIRWSLTALAAVGLALASSATALAAPGAPERAPIVASDKTGDGGISCIAITTLALCTSWQLMNLDGRAEIFWVGTSSTTGIPGALWHEWELTPGGPTSPAYSLGGYITSGIAGAENADGRLELFGRAAGGDIDHIYQKAQNGTTGWSIWYSLGGTVAYGAPVRAGNPIAADNPLHLMSVDTPFTNGTLYIDKQAASNGHWAGWQPE